MFVSLLQNETPMNIDAGEQDAVADSVDVHRLCPAFKP
jgi:hypothetical protein